jgi:D-alanyl-D-alanine carboxypeptidase/D-alanyl-D-alanine-endopeptidase (penicillin-binding protein 4)
MLNITLYFKIVRDCFFPNKTFSIAIALIVTGAIAGCSPQKVSSSSTVDPLPATSPTQTATPEKPKTVISKETQQFAQQQVERYLDSLASKGFSQETQGVWMQSGENILAENQGTVPLPAASVTKVATSLAALQTFGPDRRFVTILGTTGTIENGVLKGNLVVQGGGDPFFVWEEAIAVGNQLNRLGIKQVQGNLLVVGKFYMNFQEDRIKSGNLLKQALNKELWSVETQTQHQTLPLGTPKPQVEIAGKVEVAPTLPSDFQPLVRQHSLPLAELLKKMNRYSNNKMAEFIAESVGGAKTVARTAAATAGVLEAEIHLVNGSGLSVENRISPRAAVAMFAAIERLLVRYDLTVGDVFAIVGEDEGILETRSLPKLTVVKSGTLDSVSALVGALPTQEQGTIWFAIINNGSNLKGFRDRQEKLLSSFIDEWGAANSLPVELTPNPQRKNLSSRQEVVGGGF